MTLVKLNQRPLDKRVNSLFEDFFNHFPSRLWNEEFAGASQTVSSRNNNESL